MSELYKHSVIRGCIASKNIKKGTLILSSAVADCLGEQNVWSMYANCTSPWDKTGSPQEAQDTIKTMLASFNQMSKACQNEYMQLPNRYKDTNGFPESVPLLNKFESILRSMDEDFNEKNLEIIAIFFTNICQMNNMWSAVSGVNIKISQFHHSCNPNAVLLQRKPKVELRAIRKIKAGEAITINRSSIHLLGLIDKKFRLTLLYEVQYFICSCEICQGIEDVQDVPNTVLRMRSSLEEKFGDEMTNLWKEEHDFMGFMAAAHRWKTFYEKGGGNVTNYVTDTSLIQEHKEYYKENSQKCKDYIKTVHRLFKLGREIDAPPIYLYILVRNGYWAAAEIYNYTQHRQQRKYFADEAVNFAKTAEKFSSVLGKEVVEPEKWKKRQTTAEAIDWILG